MAGKKFYAIKRGLVPGIYDNWPAASAQVRGVAGARYKGFATRDEAVAWLAGPEPASPGPRAGRGAGAKGAPGSEASPAAGTVLIYSDGGARFNPGPGGYGAIIIKGDSRRELSGGFRLTTNNRMELTACIEALKALARRDLPVALYSDSSYVVNGIAKGWAKNWRKRGWVKSDGQPALNADLWERLLELIEGLAISFHWVKGHSGHPLNERCDELAVAAARRPGLPEDEGYKG